MYKNIYILYDMILYDFDSLGLDDDDIGWELSKVKNDLSKKIQYIMKNYESALQTGLNSKDFVKENQSVANFEFGYKKLIDLVST